MTNEVRNVPELRFFEYQKCWETITLGEATTKIGSGKTPLGGSSVYLKSGIPFLRSQNIQNGILDLNELVYIDASTDENMKNSRTYYGDILLNITGASIGRSTLNTIKRQYANLNQHVCIIRLKEFYDSNFIGQYLISQKGQKKIFMAQSGGSREGLNFKEIGRIKFMLPTDINEQQKIGGFFSKLDRQIKLEEQKLAKLEEQKKGYMQKIFSQELRFKDEKGNDYPEWRKEIVGNIATTFSGGTPSSTNSNFYNGSIPFIRSGEIYKNSTELMINEQAISNSSAKIVKVGDLLYALYGATSGEVAISKINGAINQAVLCIRSQESVGYLFNYLKMKKDQILKTYIQGGQGNLSASIIKNIDIDLPDIKEQHKIGNFFNECDELIEKQSNKIEVLKENKKSFLQKMFV